MEADEYRQAPVGMPLELAQLANKGAARLFGSVAEAPEFIYNTLAAPQNYIAEKTGLPIGTDFESVVESVGGKDAYEKVKGLWRQQAEQELKNIDDVYSKSVSELFSNGDIADGLKALSGQVAETLPYTLGIVGASIAGAPPIPLMVGTSVVSGSGKYSDLEKSEVSEGQKLLNAWGTGLAEGVSEALGTASIARGMKTIFSTMGVKAGKEESKKFAVKSITDAMKKYGAAPVGAITEGIEEMASQFAENAADISTGVDPDRKLISGLSDAFIVGVGAGGVISAPAQLKQLTDRISSKDVELMSILDEVQLEKLSNDIDQDVKDGIVSQEEGERLKTDLSQGIDAVSKTLPTDTNEKRANDANLIKEKEKLEAEIEGVDKVIAESSPQAKRIAKINEELSQESDQANDGASDQVTQETPVKEDIEKKYEDLTLDEKLELQDIAIDQMENEMAEQGIKEYELTNEMVDERASQILQQDIDNLERSLEGETRFSIAEEGESAFVADPADSEAITEEMNQMDEAEVNFTTPKGQTTSQVNPFEASNSSTNLNENEVTDLGFESQDDMVGGIEEFNGIPMITGVSDIAAGGTIKDSKGNDMNAKGGVMFNALAKVKAAWAGVKRETSQGQYDNAVKLYKKK